MRLKGKGHGLDVVLGARVTREIVEAVDELARSGDCLRSDIVRDAIYDFVLRAEGGDIETRRGYFISEKKLRELDIIISELSLQSFAVPVTQRLILKEGDD